MRVLLIKHENINGSHCNPEGELRKHLANLLDAIDSVADLAPHPQNPSANDSDRFVFPEVRSQKRLYLSGVFRYSFDASPTLVESLVGLLAGSTVPPPLNLTLSSPDTMALAYGRIFFWGGPRGGELTWPCLV